LDFFYVKGKMRSYREKKYREKSRDLEKKSRDSKNKYFAGMSSPSHRTFGCSAELREEYDKSVRHGPARRRGGCALAMYVEVLDSLVRLAAVVPWW
jgi:hypothetical protein